VFTKTGKQKRKFIATSDEVKYDTCENYISSGKANCNDWYKRLGRFMFKKDARIWLEVTDIRVERLQEISEEDAKAEGVPERYLNQTTSDGSNYVYGFNCLWNEINGIEGWNENPWCWCISFRVVSINGKP
jgi:hypothetical protein